MCEFATKWNSASSKPCNKDRNDCSLFEFNINRHVMKLKNLPQMQVTCRNAPKAIQVSTPTPPNTTKIRPKWSSRAVGETSLYSLSACRIQKCRKSAYQRLSQKKENAVEIHLTWTRSFPSFDVCSSRFQITQASSTGRACLRNQTLFCKQVMSDYRRRAVQISSTKTAFLTMPMQIFFHLSIGNRLPFVC